MYGIPFKKIQPRCRSTYQFFMGISHGGSSIAAKLNRVSKQKLPHGRTSQTKSIHFGKNPRFPTTWLWAVSPLVCLGLRIGFMEPI